MIEFICPICGGKVRKSTQPVSYSFDDYDCENFDRNPKSCDFFVSGMEDCYFQSSPRIGSIEGSSVEEVIRKIKLKAFE